MYNYTYIQLGGYMFGSLAILADFGLLATATDLQFIFKFSTFILINY